MSEATDILADVNAPAAPTTPPAAAEAAPAVAPAPAAEDPVGEGADSSVDWMEVANDDIGDDDLLLKGTETAPTPPTPEVAPPAPATPPTTPPVVAATPPAQPQVDPVQVPPVVVPTPEARQVEMDRQRQEYVTNLEARYKLNEEDAGRMVLSPNEVIPRLAANLHANIAQDVITTVMQAMQQVLPSMIDTRTTQRQETNQAEEAFFTQWPELRTHKDKVIQTGRLYRAQNPSASVEDFVKQVGMSTWLQAGLSVAELAARLDASNNSAGPTAPQQMPPAPSAGYRPASPAGGAPPLPPVGPGNYFAEMAQEMREDFF